MHNKSMAVFGLGFLVLLALIMYVGTESAETDMVPVTEQSPIQLLPPVLSEEDAETNQIDTEIETGEEESMPLPQGKIDVKVACESGLLYTSFVDSAGADAFVAECIEGKHPEVIERFISELEVDGATI